jgi:hypothetical protein
LTNARSKLKSFHVAHTLTQEGWLLSQILTEYQRFRTLDEARFQACAHIVCELLDKWDAGQLKNFDIMRAALKKCFARNEGLKPFNPFAQHRMLPRSA